MGWPCAPACLLERWPVLPPLSTCGLCGAVQGGAGGRVGGDVPSLRLFILLPSSDTALQNKTAPQDRSDHLCAKASMVS